MDKKKLITLLLALTMILSLATGASGSTPPMKPTPCDCDETVAGRKTVSLTAGPLLVGNAAVLGSVGNVLVLANDTSRRIYFVCKDQIGFLS